MVGLGRYEKFKYLLPAVGFVLWFGMLSSIAAAGSGYVLSLEGGYNDTLLWRHKWLGISTTLVSILLFFLHQKRNSKIGRKFFFPIFTLLVILLGLTGHNGGSLTHGEDFLIEPFTMDRSIDSKQFNLDSALIFQDVIQPIFEAKCVGCHNESKVKGDLLMSSIDGLRKGGKSGAFLNAGSITNSLFLQRIILPLTEKKHMPPKGKSQLSKEEVSLLNWWVKEGAVFDKHIADVKLNDDVKNILNRRNEKYNSVLAQQVEFANKKHIDELITLGCQVEIIEQSKPFLSVSLAGNKNVDSKLISKLENIAEQTIDLDLSETNITDDLLPSFYKFPNLRKLFLQNTSITGQGFDVFKDLKFLEYLNIYNSAIDDKALRSLEESKSLKQIFLWQTSLSAEALQRFREERGEVVLNLGIDQSIFGQSNLSAPSILVEADVFIDSLLVEFKMNLSEVDLFYTLDGQNPDSSSNKYKSPFYVHQSSEIKVFAKKTGWVDSKLAEKTVVRSRYKIPKVRLDKDPNEKYKDKGVATLTDSKKGTTNFGDGGWLGYEQSNVTILLDMEALVDLSGVSISALEDTRSYIFFPKSIEILLSDDGKTYTSVAQKYIPTTQNFEEAKTSNFFVGFESQKSRYLKILVGSNMKNPDWHPAPGAPCWLFLDEILVN